MFTPIALSVALYRFSTPARDDFFRKMIIVRGKDPLHFSGDGIMEVGAIPFLLDKTILDKALAD